MSQENWKSFEEKLQDLNGKRLFILNCKNKQILLSSVVCIMSESFNVKHSPIANKVEKTFGQQRKNEQNIGVMDERMFLKIFYPVRSYEVIKHRLDCGQCYEVYEIYKIERGF